MGKTSIMIGAGVIVGVIALTLAYLGNPPNMGVCVACFLRDTTGALKLQSAPPVQYMRPEVFGFIMGAFLSSLAFKTFKPQAGSVPFIRFILGFFMMIGSLVFLGCPLRGFLRIGGGDLNAVIGVAGLMVGIALGVLFLNKRFAFPSAQKQTKTEGAIFPLVCAALLGLAIVSPSLFAMSKAGPASMQAPIIYALSAGLIVGVLIERTRFCSIGFFSHILLFKKYAMMFGVIALIAVVTAGNIFLGKYKLGFELQPIAHTDILWNFLPIVLVGICGVFMGGCPLRQLVRAGTADSDATMSVLGMIIGAAVAHNFSMASAAQSAASAGGPTLTGKIFVGLGFVVVAVIGIAYSCKANGKTEASAT